MFPFLRYFPILAVFLLLGEAAVAWELESGQNFQGKAVHFDYEEKSLGIEDAVTGKVREIPVMDLSLESRQRLLIAQVFHESYPTETGWPEEKYYLLRLAIFSPMAALLLGFWIGGILITRKVNPVRALLGFFGSWMIGGIFVFFYLFFAGKFGGGTTTVLVGVVMGAVFLSLFISAVYSCNFGKAFLIFLFQIFAAGFLSVVGLALTKALVPLDRQESVWNESVFVPTGLIPPQPNPFQTVTP